MEDEEAEMEEKAMEEAFKNTLIPNTHTHTHTHTQQILNPR